ncbi:MAG: hypothetical protein NT067_02660 [Candidatus Diapherotrites archaeon]|nr:hypothetical protein [Candidatus Diapherotrites archaeon]
MKKYVLPVFFVLLLLGSASAASWAFYLLKVDSSSYKPSAVYAGNEVALAVDIKNSTVVKATDINLVLLPGQYFEPIETEKQVAEIRPNETETVVFRARAKEGIQAGSYVFSLQMQYKNLGETVTDYANVSVAVSEIYRLSIDSLKVSNYYPHTGEEILVTAGIKNTGSIEARNVSTEFSLIGASDFGKFILLSETKNDLGGIAAGETKMVEFRLKPSEKIDPGVYSFKATANCINCDKNAEEKFALQVYGYPELIVSGIDYSIKGKDSKNIVQGETFSLSVQLDNLGKEDAKKVEIEVIADDSIIGPKKSYVGSIEADDSSAGIFDLAVAENAAVGYHDVQIIITYIDELGQPQKMEEKYSFYISKMPEPNPYIPYVFVIIILAMLYFIVKMVFRQLAIRKL